jgi:hypothetical protein
VGTGNLVVTVPADSCVEVDARVEGGRLSLFGRLHAGTDSSIASSKPAALHLVMADLGRLLGRLYAKHQEDPAIVAGLRAPSMTVGPQLQSGAYQSAGDPVVGGADARVPVRSRQEAANCGPLAPKL